MTDWAYELADSLKLPLGTRNTEKIAAAFRKLAEDYYGKDDEVERNRHFELYRSQIEEDAKKRAKIAAPTLFAA